MASVQVIVEAKGRDRGARRQLRDLTKLSDALTASLGRASAAGKGLGSLPSVGQIPSAGGPRRRRSSGGSSGKSKSEREYDKTVIQEIKAERARAKEAERAARREAKQRERAAAAQERAAKRETKERERAARAAAKSARSIENINDAQLVELETQNEINARRRRAARAAAQEKLGEDPTRKKGGNRLELAENLSQVSDEFAGLSEKVESGLRGGFNAFSDFEKGVVEISTITDKISVGQIGDIAKSATREFGGQPGNQVAALNAIIGADDQLSQAGAREQLTFANKLAIGGQASQEDAVNAISKAVANFKSQGVGAKEAADSIFQAYDRGAGSVEEFARALPNVASAASAAGLTLDETNAALAVLSQRMPNVKEGSTALKAALSNLQKPTKTARDEAKRLGIDFSVAGMKAAGGLEGMLLKIRAAEKFDENTLAKLFDSSEARAAIQNLTDGMEDYRSVLADMAKKEGAAERAYQKMAGTTAQKTKKLEAQFELLKIQAGEKLVPTLLKVGEVVGPIIDKFGKWLDRYEHLIPFLTKMALGLVVVSRGLSAYTSAMSMANAITGLAQGSLDKFSGSAKAAGKNSKAAGASVKSIEPGMAKLNVALVAAAVALAAFEAVLNKAEEHLTKYEDHQNKVIDQQSNISFVNEDGSKKTDAQLLMERRNRLIAEVNASRKATFEARGGNVTDKLTKDWDIAGFYAAGSAGILNDITGVTEDARFRQRDAEQTLARFDAQYASQLGLTEDQRFTAPEGADLKELVELARKQLEATDRVATNTAGSGFLSSTLEAGV